jgi:flagellar M-ring protein FliF
MPGRAGAAARRGVATFRSFSAGQKAAVACTLVVLVVGGYLFSTWASKPTYGQLYSNLSATDASAMVDKLKSSNTPYQLTDGGTTILVPQDQVYDLRLTMSGQGLPAGKDTGYSLLDKQGVTTSEFMQNVNYQRALEGELANTISAIDGVTSATVHLAIPQPSVFTDLQQKPTASVLVATSPGRSVTSDQVQGIVHLVSSSVVGLDPAAVTVTDAKGNVLSSGGNAGDAAAAAGQAQQTGAYEQRMNSALQQMLETVVGPGHAAVHVTADLNFDSTNTQSRTYVSDGKNPPLSQTTTSETYNGNGSGPNGGPYGVGGVLGADNIQVPTTTGGTGQNTGTSTGTGTGTATPNKYAKTSTTQDNAVGMVTQTTQAAPGAVRKLNVAVLLDRTNLPKGVTEAQIQSLVTSAVGLDAKRGDTIAVTALPFDQSAAEANKKALDAAAKADKQGKLMGYAKTAGMALLIGILLLVASLRARKAGRAAELTPEEQQQLEEMQAALERSRTLALEGGTGTAVAGLPPDPQLERDRAQRQLVALVERQPDEVAQLLRGWLADRRS